MSPPTSSESCPAMNLSGVNDTPLPRLVGWATVLCGQGCEGQAARLWLARGRERLLEAQLGLVFALFLRRVVEQQVRAVHVGLPPEVWCIKGAHGGDVGVVVCG